MFENIKVPRFHDDRALLELPFVIDGTDMSDIRQCRELQHAFADHQAEAFRHGAAVEDLLNERTEFVDALLGRIFRHFGLEEGGHLVLLAVGGYGRGEMFPGSDIDILVVSDLDELPAPLSEKIEAFVSYLWDIKLDLGSSVRSINETVAESHGDITIRTNLLETHLIAGSQELYDKFLKRMDADEYWDPGRFLDAKVQEQHERYHEYRDTVYSIEPDVKNNPGGLRDLQVMLWVATLLHKVRNVTDLLRIGHFTQDEYSECLECVRFLFEVRYALHICANGSNRLTLDAQKSTAALLGYGDSGNAPVETMMRALFRTFRRVRELNDMVLQLETLQIKGQLDGEDEPVFLDSFFVQRGRYIDILDHDLFHNDPEKIVELFHQIAKHPGIRSIHVNCLKSLRNNRRALKEFLIEHQSCRETFRRLLTDPDSLSVAIPLMHETRVLSAYMPQWERIEGLTQFDMFHVFSVDEHTIRCLCNLVALQHSPDPSFSLFGTCMHQLSEPGLLNVTALLHDIAKGRGGHHAEEGAKEAFNFCRLHGFATYQIELIAWTIQNHLEFSHTATRRDIADPEVINKFATLVRDEEHLNMLYCLTVADITATNEHEWNSWKDSIFKQLYLSVRQVLRRGRESTQDSDLKAQENQQLIIENSPDLKKSDLLRYFSQFPTAYFLHYSHAEVHWHARNILRFHDPERPLILFAQHGNLGTELLVYYRSSSPMFFGNVAAAMTFKHLKIYSAQIFLTRHNHLFCTIKFQTRKNLSLDSDRLHSLRKSILDQLDKNETDLTIKRDGGGIFRVPTRVHFLSDEEASHSSVEISTLDGEGLLAKIGITLGKCGCLISAARITTTGERADDFFTVTDINGQPLDDSKKAELSAALYQALDEQ